MGATQVTDNNEVSLITLFLIIFISIIIILNS